jgi:hypothetical protein
MGAVLFSRRPGDDLRSNNMNNARAAAQAPLRPPG